MKVNSERWVIVSLFAPGSEKSEDKRNAFWDMSDCFCSSDARD